MKLTKNGRSLQRTTRTAVAARPHGSVQQGDQQHQHHRQHDRYRQHQDHNDHDQLCLQLERPAVNESDAVVLTFGLTLQQIIDVVSLWWWSWGWWWGLWWSGYKDSWVFIEKSFLYHCFLFSITIPLEHGEDEGWQETRQSRPIKSLIGGTDVICHSAPPEMLLPLPHQKKQDFSF